MKWAALRRVLAFGITHDIHSCHRFSFTIRRWCCWISTAHTFPHAFWSIMHTEKIEQNFANPDILWPTTAHRKLRSHREYDSVSPQKDVIIVSIKYNSKTWLVEMMESHKKRHHTSPLILYVALMAFCFFLLADYISPHDTTKGSLDPVTQPKRRQAQVMPLPKVEKKSWHSTMAQITPTFGQFQNVLELASLLFSSYCVMNVSSFRFSF